MRSKHKQEKIALKSISPEPQSSKQAHDSSPSATSSVRKKKIGAKIPGFRAAKMQMIKKRKLSKELDQVVEAGEDDYSPKKSGL